MLKRREKRLRDLRKIKYKKEEGKQKQKFKKIQKKEKERKAIKETDERIKAINCSAVKITQRAGSRKKRTKSARVR